MSVADDILDGIFCQECGVYLGDPVGYPQYCNDCKPVAVKKYKSKPIKPAKLEDIGKAWKDV